MKYYTWVQAWEQGWGQCPWGDLLVWQLVSLPSCPSGHKGRRVYSSNYKKCEIWSKLLRYLIRVNATEWSAGGLGVAHFDYCRFCKIRKCAFTLLFSSDTDNRYLGVFPRIKYLVGDWSVNLHFNRLMQDTLHEVETRVLQCWQLLSFFSVMQNLCRQYLWCSISCSDMDNNPFTYLLMVSSDNEWN